MQILVSHLGFKTLVCLIDLLKLFSCIFNFKSTNSSLNPSYTQSNMCTLSPIELQTMGPPDNSQIRVSGDQPLSDLGKTSFDTVGQVQFIPSFSYHALHRLFEDRQSTVNGAPVRSNCGRRQLGFPFWSKDVTVISQMICPLFFFFHSHTYAEALHIIHFWTIYVTS